MIEIISGMKADLERLKTAFGQSVQVGPVEQTDAKKGFRIKLGEGNRGPVLSPWYPHPESGGATSTWAPLSEGQIVGIMNPSGDPRQGVIFRGGFSDKNPPPSQNLNENKYVFGQTTVVNTPERLTITLGAASIEMTAESIALSLGGSSIMITPSEIKQVAPQININ